MTNLLVRWSRVATLSGLLVLIVGALILGPALLSKWHSLAQSDTATKPTLQALIESGELRNLESTKNILFLLPYDSISMQRVSGFGAGPGYLVTFYRDGRATLVIDEFPGHKRQSFSGQVSAQNYVRLTQLVASARAAAHRSRYAGMWTDDTSNAIRATSNGNTWEVSDYGRVAPPEIWALEKILHEFREQTEWSYSMGANNSFKPKPLRGSA